MRLVLCSHCQRHVRDEDGQCPFCGEKTRRSGAVVVGVAYALIVGLGVAAGCAGSTDSGGGSGGTTSSTGGATSYGGTGGSGGDGGSGGVAADAAPDAIGDGDIEGAVAAYGPPPDANGTGGIYGPPPP